VSARGAIGRLIAWSLTEADRQLADDPTDETAREMKRLALDASARLGELVSRQTDLETTARRLLELLPTGTEGRH
jgi:hypothetical protein